MMARVFVFCLCLFLPHSAAGSIDVRQNVLHVLFDGPCAQLGVPKTLALAIARHESGLHPYILNIAGKAVHLRTQEQALHITRQALARGLSFDVGLMQVNVYWIKKYKLPLETVLDPQSNVKIGVWILSQEIKRHGLSWRAVASYHTPLHKNPDRGRAYALAILNQMRKLRISK